MGNTTSGKRPWKSESRTVGYGSGGTRGMSATEYGSRMDHDRGGNFNVLDLGDVVVRRSVSGASGAPRLRGSAAPAQSACAHRAFRAADDFDLVRPSH